MRSPRASSCHGAGGFVVHPIAQDEEGQPEGSEGVRSSQLVVLHVDVELFASGQLRNDG
jgi:hypothetical protein